VEGVKLVQLRNPHGHYEWKGPWKDQGPEWKKNPQISKALQMTVTKGRQWDDGAFWMAYRQTWQHFFLFGGP